VDDVLPSISVPLVRHPFKVTYEMQDIRRGEIRWVSNIVRLLTCRVGFVA